MKKKEIVKDSNDFTRIIKKKNGSVNKSYIVNYEINKEDKTLFGITFVHNIGNAVLRNKLKRRTKQIIDNNKKIFKKGRNYIIIIRKEAINKSYQELESDLCILFHNLKEKKDEEK